MSAGDDTPPIKRSAFPPAITSTLGSAQLDAMIRGTAGPLLRALARGAAQRGEQGDGNGALSHLPVPPMLGVRSLTAEQP